MKKIIKPATIGCVLLLGFSISSCGFEYIKKPVKDSEKITITIEANINEVRKSIRSASSALEEGYRQFSLYCLERALGENPSTVKQKVTLDELVETAKQVIDKYIGYESLKGSLYSFAYNLYEEQKKEIAKNTLKDELQNNWGNFYFRGIKDYPAASVWLIYNINLNETGSIRKTHENVRDYYNGPLVGKHIDSILTKVENAIPK